MDKSGPFKRQRKIKQVAPLLKFYQELTSARDIYNNVFDWYYLVDGLSQLIQKYAHLIPVSALQSRIVQVSNLTDESKSGIEKACKDLQIDLKNALEDFFGEDLEIILKEPIRPRPSPFILGGSGGGVVIVGIVVWLMLTQFNFVVSTDENLFSVLQGNELTIPVNLKLEKGDPRDLTVHCSSSSLGITCNPSQKSVYLDGSEVIMFDINTASETPAGSHNVIFKAEKDYITKQQFVQLSVEQEQIFVEQEQIFVELEPISQLSISSITPKKDGRIISMPLNLLVRVNADFPMEGANVEFLLDGNVIDTTTTDSEGYASTQILTIDNGNHFWSAKASKENYESAKLNVHQFTSSFAGGAPPAPVLLEPKSGAIINGDALLFRWHSVSDESGIDRYTIELTSIDGRVVFRENLSSNQFSSNKTLEDGTYAWKVRAIDGTGNAGLFSEIFVFNIKTLDKYS